MDLDFPEPTSSTNYVVPTLRLDEGTFIFTYLNAFLSYITPHDLPVGMSDETLDIFFLLYIDLDKDQCFNNSS